MWQCCLDNKTNLKKKILSYTNPLASLFHFCGTSDSFVHLLSSVALMFSKWSFPGGSDVKSLPTVQETWVQSLGREDLLEKGRATHFSILA